MTLVGLFILFFICAIVIVGTLFGMVVIGLVIGNFIAEMFDMAADRALKAVKRRKKKNDLV